MRLIWEKKMDLTKEEVRERLYAYLLEKKYMRKKNNNSILFYYNGKIPHRFFQIRYNGRIAAYSKAGYRNGEAKKVLQRERK